jgi:ankyrin repeat protein
VVISTHDPLGRAAVQAIHDGDVAGLERLLAEHQGLANARVVDSRDSRHPNQASRTLLHVATDWPGHFPNVAATIHLLADAGADVDARFAGAHAETPLHWAASCDDVAALDALLDSAADIEAPGAVIAGGTPLADAVAFGQWRAARRLIERGAHTTLWQAAALGLMERVESDFRAGPTPDRHEITKAFWCACHGGQQAAAALLLDRGADINWVGFDGLTPLDAASRSGAHELAGWLRSRGGLSAGTLR